MGENDYIQIGGGWRCPGCGACYAPWVYKCDVCPQTQTSTVSDGSVVSFGGGLWVVCSKHARMHPTGEACPMCCFSEESAVFWKCEEHSRLVAPGSACPVCAGEVTG